MLNMADKKNSSQPLIRAIKEELLKLSQKTPGRTKVQELNGVTLSASGTWHVLFNRSFGVVFGNMSGYGVNIE